MKTASTLEIIFTVLSTCIAIIGFILTLTALKVMIITKEYVYPNNRPTILVFCANIVIAVIAVPLYLVSIWIDDTRISILISCNIVLPLLMIYLHSVVISHAVIYMHMLFGVRFPYKYQTVMMKKILSIVTFMLFFSMLIIDCIPFLYYTSEQISYCYYHPKLWWCIVIQVAYGLIPLPFIVAVSLYLIKTAAGHDLKLLRLNKQVEGSINNTTSKSDVPCTYCYILTLKATQYSFLVLLCHLLFLCPMIVLMLIMMINDENFSMFTHNAIADTPKCIVVLLLISTTVFTSASLFLRKKMKLSQIVKILCSFSKKEIKHLVKNKQKGKCTCGMKRKMRIESTSSSFSTYTSEAWT